MTNEMDLDAWIGEGIDPRSDIDEAKPTDPPGAAELVGPAPDKVSAFGVPLEVDPAPMEQMGFDGTATLIALDNRAEADLAKYLRGLILGSRSGKGDGHIVTILEIPDGNGGLTRVVSCTCEAIRNLNRRPLGCWGMRITRMLAGIPDPT